MGARRASLPRDARRSTQKALITPRNLAYVHRCGLNRHNAGPFLAAAGEDGAVAPRLAKGGQEETPAHPASVERLACHLLFFVTFEQIAETGENSLPAGSEFAPRDLCPPSAV